ncbi:MAG: helix-turn-helix domain-containing protein [Geminicoccaceae bacterium]
MKIITTRDIKNETARFYDIPISILDDPGRERAHALPRQVAMYLSRRMTRLTLDQIGEKFQRHHTNVFYAVKAIKQRPWAMRAAAAVEERLRA